MTLKTWSDGDILYAADLNGNFSFPQILDVYTGNGFDTSSGGTTSASYEFADISAAALGVSNYLEIKLTLSVAAYCALTGSVGATTIKIESKDLGGAYSTDLSNNLFTVAQPSTTANLPTHTEIKTISWIHTLTVNEKANGIKIKITSTSTAAASGTSSVTNKQAVLQLR